MRAELAARCVPSVSRCSRGSTSVAAKCERQIGEFEGAVEPGDEVFFFYAGHGVALGKDNYLIPVDMPVPKAGDEKRVRQAAVSTAEIVSRIKKTGAGVSFLVFDACRNNPFQSQGTRSISGIGKTRGLARVEAPKGTLVVFSAGFGQAALDGLSAKDPNPNSVFTRTLIPLMKKPGITHVELAKEVQTAVAELAATVEHEQKPAIVDQVRGNIVLNPGADEGEAAAATEQPPAVAGSDAGSTDEAAADGGEEVVELSADDVLLGQPAGAEEAPPKTTKKPAKSLDVKAAWAALEGSDDVAAYVAFRQRYGAANPFFDRLAGKRIEQLGGADEAPAAAETDVAVLQPKQVDVPPAVEFTDVTDCDSLVASPFDETAVAQGVDWNDVDAAAASSACQAAVSEHPNVPRLEYQYARALEKSGDDSEAAKYYGLAAGQGHVLAMSNLGVLYASGRGVEQNDKEAFRLYSLAVDKGDVGAMTNLGIFYASGRGVAQDDSKAVELWTVAATKGDALAMSNLGMMYANGRGTEQSDTEAAKLWKAAADKGNAFAMYNLAFLLANGSGVDKDPDAAAGLVIAALQKRHGATMRDMQGGAERFDAEFRMALQRRLQEAGAYDGPIDGIFSEAMNSALVKITGQQ